MALSAGIGRSRTKQRRFDIFRYHNPSTVTRARLTRAQICKRLRSPEIDSDRLGIDSWAPQHVYKHGLSLHFQEHKIILHILLNTTVSVRFSKTIDSLTLLTKDE
jgi:hypothetical protein